MDTSVTQCFLIDYSFKCIYSLKVIFSDEKRFCLDGPDGYRNYWRDLRRDPLIFAKRPMGGEGLMVWAGISTLGRTQIVFVRGKMNSEGYQEILENFLIPFMDRWPHLELVFQRDNASVHVSTPTRQWFASKNLPLLEWPAKSPDLSPIENVRSMLARAVYANGRQFNTIIDLKKAIIEEWERLDQNKIRELIGTMNKRLIKVIAKNGGITHY